MQLAEYNGTGSWKGVALHEICCSGLWNERDDEYSCILVAYIRDKYIVIRPVCFVAVYRSTFCIWNTWCIPIPYKSMVYAHGYFAYLMYLGTEPVIRRCARGQFVTHVLRFIWKRCI